jgi:hypothetical protein
VAHTCNPSYSRGRDQEDLGSKAAWVIVHETLSQKKPSKNRADRVAQGEALRSIPSTAKNKIK